MGAFQRVTLTQEDWARAKEKDEGSPAKHGLYFHHLFANFAPLALPRCSLVFQRPRHVEEPPLDRWEDRKSSWSFRYFPRITWHHKPSFLSWSFHPILESLACRIPKPPFRFGWQTSSQLTKCKARLLSLPPRRFTLSISSTTLWVGRAVESIEEVGMNVRRADRPSFLSKWEPMD